MKTTLYGFQQDFERDCIEESSDFGVYGFYGDLIRNTCLHGALFAILLKNIIGAHQS